MGVLRASMNPLCILHLNISRCLYSTPQHRREKQRGKNKKTESGRMMDKVRA